MLIANSLSMFSDNLIEFLVILEVVGNSEHFLDYWDILMRLLYDLLILTNGLSMLVLYRNMAVKVKEI